MGLKLNKTYKTKCGNDVIIVCTTVKSDTGYSCVGVVSIPNNNDSVLRYRIDGRILSYSKTRMDIVLNDEDIPND